MRFVAVETDTYKQPKDQYDDSRRGQDGEATPNRGRRATGDDTAPGTSQVTRHKAASNNYHHCDDGGPDEEKPRSKRRGGIGGSADDGKQPDFTPVGYEPYEQNDNAEGDGGRNDRSGADHSTDHRRTTDGRMADKRATAGDEAGAKYDRENVQSQR